VENLERYTQVFDKAYPNYGEVRYREVLNLVEAYNSADAMDYVRGESFARAASLIKPLTAIKNYKSQVPYPEDLESVIACVINIKRTPVDPNDAIINHSATIKSLLELEGFQLPTVSAILHFCHPNDFPIVDVNVQAACALLKERQSSDFDVEIAPRLPAANTSPENKIDRYRHFIQFIDTIVELQRVYRGDADYRYVDKALMVLGVLRLRNQVERDEGE
jgi:hypothetical protein